MPATACTLPDGFQRAARLSAGRPGVQAPLVPKSSADREAVDVERFCQALSPDRCAERFPAGGAGGRQRLRRPDAEQLAVGDVHALQPGGGRARHRRLHAAEALGLRGPLVIDARIKPHHAPPLEEDPDVSAPRRCAGGAGSAALPDHLSEASSPSHAMQSKSAPLAVTRKLSIEEPAWLIVSPGFLDPGGGDSGCPHPNRVSSRMEAMARQMPTTSVRLRDSSKKRAPMPVSKRIMQTE